MVGTALKYRVFSVLRTRSSPEARQDVMTNDAVGSHTPLAQRCRPDHRRLPRTFKVVRVGP